MRRIKCVIVTGGDCRTKTRESRNSVVLVVGVVVSVYVCGAVGFGIDLQEGGWMELGHGGGREGRK